MRLAGRTILGSIVLLWGVQGASALQLESTEIAEGAPIAQAQAWPQCKGENISPTLTWSGVPEGTKSFAVTVLDPGAMGGKGFWHWLIFNIPADARGLAQGAGAADGSKAPAGAVQGVNDFGTAGYAGPCPPKGQTHRYVFTLWALDTETLPFRPDVTGAQARPQLQLHALGKAMITPRYSH